MHSQVQAMQLEGDPAWIAANEFLRQIDTEARF